MRHLPAFRPLLSALALAALSAFWTAQAAETALALPGEAEVAVVAGESLLVVLSGPEGAVFWAGDLPEGLALDPATGAISGVLGAAGEWAVSVGASTEDGFLAGTLRLSCLETQAPAAVPAVVGAGPNHVMRDFNGDGKDDILWRNAVNHNIAIWCMNGSARTAGVTPNVQVGADWVVAGYADFDGDGKADILWRNIENGKLAIWFMNGGNRIRSANLSHGADFMWDVVGVGDFNGNGKADILWRNRETHKLVIWYMDGANRTGTANTNVQADATWEVVGVGDFDGDGKADILWYNVDNHKTLIWTMNGPTRVSSVYTNVQAGDAMYEVEGAADLFGIGKSCIIFRHRETHKALYWQMNGATRVSNGNLGMQVLRDYEMQPPRSR